MSFSRHQHVSVLPPSISSGNFLPPMLSIVEPLERENLIINPSFEVDATNWSGGGGGAASRSVSDSFKGAACLECTLNSSEYVIYGAATPLALVSGLPYMLSMYVRAATSTTNSRAHTAPLRLAFATTGDVVQASRSFKATSDWNRIIVPFTPTSSTDYRVLFIRDAGVAADLVYYIDAVQVERCTAGNVFATTYIDGDQLGTLPGQSPPPYFWTGTPHLSTSVRLATTRAGGRVTRLDRLGFQLLGIEGAGSPSPDVQTTSFTEFDGESLQRIRKPAHDITLLGRIDEVTLRRLRALNADLSTLFDRDFVSDEQPLKLLFQPMDELNNPTGDECEIICTYTDGLGGRIDNFNTSPLQITFRVHYPGIRTVRESTGGTIGIAAAVPSGTNFMASRTRDGVWRNVASGVTGGSVHCIMVHSNGKVWVGGAFTAAGATSADFLAIYDPVLDTWSNVGGSDTTFNATVYCLAEAPNGDVIAGGDFTDAGSIDGDRIVQISADGATLTAMGAGAPNGSVRALKCLGNNVFAGGTFTSIDIVANTNSIARFDRTALTWNAMGTGATVNNGIFAMDGRGDVLYVGGNVTTMGGVANTTRLAKYTISTDTWSAMGTGANNTVQAILMHPKTNLVYIGGIFDQLNGVAAGKIGAFNGFAFEPVGPSNSLVGGGDQIKAIAFDLNRHLWMVGAFANMSDSTITWTDGVARFTGSAWLMAPLDTTGSTVNAIQFAKDGRMYLGWTNDSDPLVQAVATVTNETGARTFPKIRLTFTDTIRLFGLENITTNKRVCFNIEFQAGETFELDFDPRRVSFVSSIAADVAYSVLPGSQVSEFYLQPGVNILAILCDSIAGGSATIHWPRVFASIDEAWPQAIRGI